MTTPSDLSSKQAIPIEHSLQPTTVNEVLLLNRIRELTIAGYDKDLTPGFLNLLDSEYTVSFPAPTTLQLVASLESGWENDQSLIVRARSYGRTDADLGYHYYISKEQLWGLSKHSAAQMLSTLHSRMIRSLAEAIGK